jgi:hypothetical protein
MEVVVSIIRKKEHKQLQRTYMEHPTTSEALGFYTGSTRLLRRSIPRYEGELTYFPCGKTGIPGEETVK